MKIEFQRLAKYVHFCFNNIYYCAIIKYIVQLMETDLENKEEVLVTSNSINVSHYYKSYLFLLKINIHPPFHK